MGRKANPAVIGAFVVGAIALAVIGVLVFGSGQMFKHNVKIICFFSGTVNGLNVGAPVKFKGVDVGSVKDIRLRFGNVFVSDAETVSQGVRIPVFLEIDPDKLTTQGARRDFRDPKRVRELIDLGLRAQLNAQSIVTGLLFIQLDFHPEVPATFYLPAGSEDMEIPTMPTTLERVQSAAAEVIRKLEDIRFDAMVKSATEVLEAIKNVVNSPGLKQTLETLPTTVDNVNEAVTSLRRLTMQLNEKQGPLLESLKVTSDKTGLALDQAQVTLRSVQTFVDSRSPFAVQLSASLQEVAGAARSLRLLADYLERNPSAVVRGKDMDAK